MALNYTTTLNTHKTKFLTILYNYQICICVLNKQPYFNLSIMTKSFNLSKKYSITCKDKNIK